MSKYLCGILIDSKFQNILLLLEFETGHCFSDSGMETKGEIKAAAYRSWLRRSGRWEKRRSWRWRQRPKQQQQNTWTRTHIQWRRQILAGYCATYLLFIQSRCIYIHSPENQNRREGCERYTNRLQTVKSRYRESERGAEVSYSSSSRYVHTVYILNLFLSLSRIRMGFTKFTYGYGYTYDVFLCNYFISSV